MSDSNIITAREGNAASARARRTRLARKYRPQEIDLLLVAEAPPAALDRYFYFSDVATQDSLFRYVVRTVLTTEPRRDRKKEQLEALQRAGVFLVDLSLDPDFGPLSGYVSGLIRRIRALKPRRIILVKASVYDAAFAALNDACLPVLDARIPFPGSGHQIEFEKAMRLALKRKPSKGTGC
jgi:hypothetical protein